MRQHSLEIALQLLTFSSVWQILRAWYYNKYALRLDLLVSITLLYWQTPRDFTHPIWYSHMINIELRGRHFDVKVRCSWLLLGVCKPGDKVHYLHWLVHYWFTKWLVFHGRRIKSISLFDLTVPCRERSSQSGARRQSPDSLFAYCDLWTPLKGYPLSSRLLNFTLIARISTWDCLKIV